MSMELIRKKCDKCDLVIEGTTQGQVDNNLAVHKAYKHTRVKKNGDRVER
jgi:hypothetical protein